MPRLCRIAVFLDRWLTFAPFGALFLSVAASPLPSLVCWWGGVSFVAYRTQLGRVVGLGSANKIPVPYKPSFSLLLFTVLDTHTPSFICPHPFMLLRGILNMNIIMMVFSLVRTPFLCVLL